MNKRIILLIFVAGLVVGAVLPLNMLFMSHVAEEHDNMDSMAKREGFIEMREAIQRDMLGKGMYKCCLEKPCTYCIEKTPGHGDGAACSCLEDIVNGQHPCGECIGEILEGHGNKYLAEYFAKAIAQETGNYEAIRDIISEKYDISIEEQVV